MYSKHLEGLISQGNKTIADGFYQLYTNGYRIIIIVDEAQKFIGVCGHTELMKYSNQSSSELNKYTLSDVCNKSPQICIFREDIYQQAAYIFSIHPNIHVLPIIDDDRNVIDIIDQNQVYYRQKYLQNELPRMHYARSIYSSAELAKKLDYERISVIEFGVAGGNGLVNIEFHAKEIERLTGVKIDIYGFDSGEGLPNNNDVRNSPYIWFDGSYKMDIEKLKSRLTVSKLIIGDISQTSQDFFDSYNPAPIGAMLVDVDYYTSTVPILDMLTKEHKYFLPRINMYFDDIMPFNEVIGENLAICEFNNANTNIKISPEGAVQEKLCHLFEHKDYTTRLCDASVMARSLSLR